MEKKWLHVFVSLNQIEEKHFKKVIQVAHKYISIFSGVLVQETPSLNYFLIDGCLLLSGIGKATFLKCLIYLL